MNFEYEYQVSDIEELPIAQGLKELLIDHRFTREVTQSAAR